MGMMGMMGSSMAGSMAGSVIGHGIAKTMFGGSGAFCTATFAPGALCSVLVKLNSKSCR